MTRASLVYRLCFVLALGRWPVKVFPKASNSIVMLMTHITVQIILPFELRRRSAVREVSVSLAYLCDSSVRVDFYQGRAEKVHPVVAKQPIHRLDLFLSVGLVNHVFTRWQVRESA